MSTLIVYATQHGCAEGLARELSKKLEGPVVLHDLKSGAEPALDSFDAIVLGGSIHAGGIQKAVKVFCASHASALLTKRLGLYLCCMDEEKSQSQFEKAFPKALRDHAQAKGVLGGAFDFERMNFFEKTIVKKVAGISSSTKRRDEAAIEAFIVALNQR